MRTSWNNTRTRWKRKTWNKKEQAGKNKRDEDGDKNEADEKKRRSTCTGKLSPSFPTMNHSSGNSILKQAKISPSFHMWRYKPSAINTPSWSTKDPECTSMQPSATLRPCISYTNSATHLSTVSVTLFKSPHIVSWSQEQVCPEIQRETRSTCPLHPKLKHTQRLSSFKHDSNSR